jgi:hypothetical protein
MTIFGDDRSGLTINARIAARTPAEHRAQEGLGTRCLPWDELDARAGEIVGLVDGGGRGGNAGGPKRPASAAAEPLGR